MAATVHDVAHKAGVSVGTVSRYLNGYQLQKKNRHKVEQAIKALGFKENVMARGLKRRRSMTIAVLIPDFDIFVTSLITKLEQLIEAEKYSLITCNYQDDPQQLQKKLRFLKDRLIDGVILFPSILGGASRDILQEYVKEKIPVVLVDHLIPGFQTDAVIVDNLMASYCAPRMLIQHHHQHIAIINGRRESMVSQERLQGYYNAMQEHNLPVRDAWITWGDFSQVGGYNAAKAVCSSPEAPTAIYATNYAMTLGAFLALHELRLRIPDDMSLFGFDHFESMDLIEPGLTMIEQPIDLIAQNAARLILRRIKGDYSDFFSTIKLNTTIVHRQSIKNVNSTRNAECGMRKR